MTGSKIMNSKYASPVDCTCTDINITICIDALTPISKSCQTYFGALAMVPILKGNAKPMW